MRLWNIIKWNWFCLKNRRKNKRVVKEMEILDVQVDWTILKNHEWRGGYFKDNLSANEILGLTIIKHSYECKSGLETILVPWSRENYEERIKNIKDLGGDAGTTQH